MINTIKVIHITDILWNNIGRTWAFNADTIKIINKTEIDEIYYYDIWKCEYKVRWNDDINTFLFPNNSDNTLNYKIKNGQKYFEYIGFNIEYNDIAIIEKAEELYEATVIGADCKVIDRLINESSINELLLKPTFNWSLFS